MIRFRRCARICIFFILVLLTLSAGYPIVYAQSNPDRVGLVIQFKDGSTIKQCVEIDGVEAKGYDVLINSGFSIIADFNAWLGAGVCKIGNDGCGADDCFCDMPNYWSYWHLGQDAEGQPGWQYSNLGASNYIVHAGDVEGWHYGEASPPIDVPFFDEICAAPTATATFDLIIPAASPTSPPPTIRSIPPTTPPQWATAIIIGPTQPAFLPTSPPTATLTKLPSVLSPTAIPSSLTPAASENSQLSVSELQPTLSPISELPIPTRIELEPSATQTSSQNAAAPQTLPTATSVKMVNLQESGVTPVSQFIQPPDSHTNEETNTDTGVSHWVMILGGLAGFGSFMGFFLVLLGGLVAVYLLRRK